MHHETTLVQVAVKTLLKELIAAYEARHREQRTPAKIKPCEQREQEGQSCPAKPARCK